MPLNTQYTSFVRLYIFEAIQLLDVLLQSLYLIVFLVLSLTSSFHQMLAVLSISIFLRATFCFCSVISFAISTDASQVLQVSLYIDNISLNFSSLTIFVLALHRCMMFKSPRLNQKLFGSFFHFFILIAILCFSVALSFVQIRTGNMERIFLLDSGLVDFQNTSTNLHRWLMRTCYIYPILTVLCYVALYIHIHKSPVSSLTNHEVRKEEKHVALQFITISVMQLIFYGVNEFNMALPSNLRAYFSIDLLMSYISYLPEMMLPLFLIASKLELREGIEKFKQTRGGNAFVVTNFY